MYLFSYICLLFYVCFSSVGVSFIKLHSQSLSGKKTLSKRKMKAIVSSIKEKLAKTLNVEQNDITISKMLENQSRDDAEEAASYDRLLNLLKEKVDKASTSSEKINNHPRLLVNQSCTRLF